MQRNGKNRDSTMPDRINKESRFMDDHNKLDKILRFFFFDLVEKHRENRRHTRLLAVDHLLDWARCFLPHHFSEAPSKMHLWLADRLDEARTRRGTKLNVLAPRGAAKSTVATLAYPLRELLERREPYIWLVSDTMSQAYAHLENIKCELLENGKIANRYPNCVGKGPVWRNGAVILRNGAAIEAYGTGQRLRGRRRREHRPTLILCDDLQDDNHIVSEGAVTKLVPRYAAQGRHGKNECRQPRHRFTS